MADGNLLLILKSKFFCPYFEVLVYIQFFRNTFIKIVHINNIFFKIRE